MLPWSLPPLLRAVRRVVLIDNGSTDGTPDVARAVADAHGGADRLAIHTYPFAIARCGAEHLATPAASVHSLVHFYNWSFAHVRTGYALKWDGDMVLTDAAAALLRDLAWQLEAAEAVLRIPRHPLYLADDRRAYLDTALRNCEPWGWPNRPGYSFAKALDWELPLWAARVPALTLPDWQCVELKHLDTDEFAHWSDTDFAASSRQRRKQREWEVFGALRRGLAPPDGVVAIESPDDRHVVDYVREAWLPGRAAGAPPVTPARRAPAPA
jgi:glycosyltransferase involved in cell wall biosynthesis